MAARFTVEQVFKAKDQFTRPVRGMQKSILRMTNRARRGLRKLNKGFAAVRTGIKRTGLAVIAGAAAAGVALKNIVGTGAEFEQAITNVGAVSLKSRADIAKLEKQALDLGASTKFTATEVANAMEIMAKAGFDVEQTFAGIPGVLDAAAASGLEIAEVSRVVSSALKAFASQGLKTTEVADILALASARTQSDILSLGESLKNVASTADSLEIPFKDTVAAVALLQDVGLDASVAGSALNTMLTKLAKPPKKLARELKKMGVVFQDSSGDMLALPVVLQNIGKAMDEAGGNMKQAALLADLVGLRGQKAASNLAKLAKSGKLKELTEELGNAAGAAKKMAELRMKTLEGDLLKLEAATDGFKIALFKLEGGPLRGVVQEMTNWIEKNKEVKLQQISTFIKDIVKNQDVLLDRLKTLGTSLVVFFAFSAAVKVAQVAVAAFQVAMQILNGVMFIYNKRAVISAAVTKAYGIALFLARGATFALGLATTATTTKLAGMNVAMNASKIGTAINGITGKLGKAGLLGAALAVGFAFGSWLDHQFGISDMLSKWLAQVTGVNKELEKAGGRAAKRGVGAGGKVFADGTIIDAAGKVVRGPDVLSRRNARVRQREEARGAPAPEVVSPEDRISRQITESITETNQSIDMRIRDESGRAEIMSRPPNMSIVMDQSASFSDG